MSVWLCFEDSEILIFNGNLGCFMCCLVFDCLSDDNMYVLLQKDAEGGSAIFFVFFETLVYFLNCFFVVFLCSLPFPLGNEHDMYSSLVDAR